MKQIVHVMVWLSLTLLPAVGMQAQAVISVADTVVSDVFEIDLSEDYVDLELKTTITNVSDTTIFLQWTRLELDKPGEWDTQVCDNIECYIPIVSSNIDPQLGIDAPVRLEPDSSFSMILYVVPNGVAGNGRIELDIALAGQPEDILETIVYLPEVRERTVSNVDELLAPNLRIYPNPAADYFELTSHEGIDEIIISDMFGRQIRTYAAISGKSYDISQLSNGIYLVSLVNRQYGIIRTLRLGKRSVRP